MMKFSCDVRTAVLVALLTAVGILGPNNLQAASPFTYALTVNGDPVQPGQVAEFDLTVTNTSSTSQNATLYYTVPTYTYGDDGFSGSSYYDTGTSVGVNFGGVPAGTSVTRPVRIQLQTTTPAPDGTPITPTFVDQAHGASISRTIIAHNAPVLGLQLSNNQATVTRGGAFAYTIAYHAAGAVSGVVLTVPIPANATFVSTNAGGTLGGDGFVRWQLGALPNNASGRVQMTLSATTTSSASGPIIVEADLTDTVGDKAHASAATLINAFPTLTYALTTNNDPVQPGQVAEFDLTVTNTGSVSQNATVYYTVPTYTYGDNGFSGSSYYLTGSDLGVSFGSVPAGTSVTRSVRIQLLTTTPAPDGTPITPTFIDETRGASISRTIIAHNAPTLGLQLSTNQATAAPGSSFVYTLAYRSAVAAPGALLRVSVPANATFVSADSGGVVGSDGVVQWSLGSLPVGASGQVHLTLSASNASSTSGPVVVDAGFADGAGNEARASAAMQVNAFPTFNYALTTSADIAQPGQVVTYYLTLTNTGSVSQNATVYYTVPTYTYGDNGFSGSSYYLTGSDLGVSFGSVPAGTSVTRSVRIQLLTTTPAPDGTPITPIFIDETSGASISRLVTVRLIPQVGGATTAGATQGQPFSYQVAATNYPASYGASGLPTGLSINPSTGLISGTPTASGNFSIGLTATNPAGAGTGTLTLTVAAASPRITSFLSASTQVGLAFTYQITGTYAPYGFNATGLPNGLSVNGSSGLISGTPTASGVYQVVLSATNAGGTGNATLALTISMAPPPPPIITSQSSASGQVGQPFSYQIAATNNPTSFGTSGLPAGLSLDAATGLISGTPTSAATYSVPVSATNTSGTGSLTITLSIISLFQAPTITSPPSANGQVGQPFSYQITATNSASSFAAGSVYSSTSGLTKPLPAGLSLNPTTGQISGTPTREGDFVVAIQAQNAAGSDLKQIKLTITTVDGQKHPPFFTGEEPLSNGVYYLKFFYAGDPNGYFSYYAYLSDPHYIYHFDMGYLYWFDANDGKSGIYFYDFTSQSFFYTSPSFPFPYLYDFSLNAVLYYYPDTIRPGSYTTNPRYFFNTSTGQIITK